MKANKKIPKKNKEEERRKGGGRNTCRMHLQASVLPAPDSPDIYFLSKKREGERRGEGRRREEGEGGERGEKRRGEERRDKRGYKDGLVCFVVQHPSVRCLSDFENIYPKSKERGRGKRDLGERERIRGEV